MDLFLYDRDVRHKRVNIILSYIFPENLIKIHEIVQIFFFNFSHFCQFVGIFDISLLQTN